MRESAPYGALAQWTEYAATNRKIGVRLPYALPEGCSIAPADDCEDGYGDGPIRIGSGGLVVVVEAAHNDNLTNSKKFVIIYIQVKELLDIVPHIKGSYSKLRLEE